MENRNDTFYLTPIGPVPTNFDFFPELLKQAYIGYRDQRVSFRKKDGEVPAFDANGRQLHRPSGEPLMKKQYSDAEEIVRSWFIVQDPGMVPVMKTTPAGRRVKDGNRVAISCNGHRKFCMILDFVRHTIEKSGDKIDQGTVLRIAIGKQSFYETPLGGRVELGEQVASLRLMDVRTLQNTISKRGVPGYEPVADPLPDL